MRCSVPAIEDNRDGEKRDGVEQESSAGPGRGDDQAADSGSHRASYINRNTVQSQRCGQFGAAYQFRNDCLPCWCAQCNSEAKEECKQKEDGRRDSARYGHHSEDRRYYQHPDLRKYKESSSVHDVGECTGRQGQKKDRQTFCRLKE